MRGLPRPPELSPEDASRRLLRPSGHPRPQLSRGARRRAQAERERTPELSLGGDGEGHDDASFARKEREVWVRCMISARR